MGMTTGVTASTELLKQAHVTAQGVVHTVHPIGSTFPSLLTPSTPGKSTNHDNALLTAPYCTQSADRGSPHIQHPFSFHPALCCNTQNMSDVSHINACSCQLLAYNLCGLHPFPPACICPQRDRTNHCHCSHGGHQLVVPKRTGGSATAARRPDHHLGVSTPCNLTQANILYDCFKQHQHDNMHTCSGHYPVAKHAQHVRTATMALPTARLWATHAVTLYFNSALAFP